MSFASCDGVNLHCLSVMIKVMTLRMHDMYVSALFTLVMSDLRMVC